MLIGISDAEVLDIFAKMNTYAVQLNRQEFRNGKYFGHFKQSCYTLAHEYLGCWRHHGVFTERGIARMIDVEFTSELLVQGLAGLQDKKSSLDGFYADYDDLFTDQSEQEREIAISLERHC